MRRHAQRATLVASFCAVLLACAKLVVGFSSNSVAVLSSAVDSLLDSFVSLLNFLALKKAQQKATSKYNFGFGKIEALMSLFESLVIAMIGLFILYQSVVKIYHAGEVENLQGSFWVMILSLFVTTFLVLFLSFWAKRSKSLILQTDCLHYKVDFLSNFAILLTLGLIYFTNWHFLDAITGICISLYILYSAFSLLRKALELLMDKALDEKIVQKIIVFIEQNPHIISFHEFQTRTSGEMNYLNVHLVLCENLSLIKAHQIGDELEAKIKNEFKDEKWSIQIHLDYYDDSSKD